MAGAPALAAMAALRSGAGLVDLAAPAPAASIAAAFDPCVMTHPLPARHDGTFAGDALAPIAALAARADVLAVGPGMGRSEPGEGIPHLLDRNNLCEQISEDFFSPPWRLPGGEISP